MKSCSQTYCENFVEKITNANGLDLWQSVFLGIVFTFIFARSYISVTGFLALFIGISVSYLWLTRKRIYETDEMNEINKNLQKLQLKMDKKISFYDTTYKSVLYKNPALVKVFIKLCPFSKFDSSNFKWSLTSANELVKVYESAKIGLLVPNQTIDIAEQLQREIVNNMEAIINSLPSTVIADYRFQPLVTLLDKVVQNIVNDIKVIYEDHYEQNGPNIYNPPPSTRSGPWANPLKAKDYNEFWNFYY